MEHERDRLAYQRPVFETKELRQAHSPKTPLCVRIFLFQCQQEKTEQRRRCRRRIGIHRHSVKSPSRVPFKATRRPALFSIRPGIHRARGTQPGHKGRGRERVEECEALPDPPVLDQRETRLKNLLFTDETDSRIVPFRPGISPLSIKKKYIHTRTSVHGRVYTYIYVSAYRVFEFRSNDKREINMQNHFPALQLPRFGRPYRTRSRDGNATRRLQSD